MILYTNWEAISIVEGIYWEKKKLCNNKILECSIAEYCAKSKALFLCKLSILAFRFSFLYSSAVVGFVSGRDFPMQICLVSDTAASLCSK